MQTPLPFKNTPRYSPHASTYVPFSPFSPTTLQSPKYPMTPMSAYQQSRYSPNLAASEILSPSNNLAKYRLYESKNKFSDINYP